MLEVRSLSVWYGDVPAVREVSLEVHEGEVVGLLGSNGAGKSTTLMAISGARAKCKGSVRFLGREVLGRPPHELARWGLAHVPEGRRIFPSLSVEENLRMGAYTNPMRWRENLKKVYHLFPVLEQRRHQLGSSLSGGEQQMLAIGRALMSEPRLLLLDEPSLGLAPKMVDLLHEVIRNLRKAGLAVLLVEQTVSVALEVVERVYVMNLGRIEWSGHASELRKEEGLRRLCMGNGQTDQFAAGAERGVRP